MRRICVCLGSLILGIFVSCKTGSHFSQKYPYGLLTSDYRILNEDDLGVYAWWAKSTPFDDSSVSGYMYWQCYPISMVKLGCKKVGSDDPGIQYADADIRIETETEIHEYEFRKAVESAVCYEYLKHWKQLIKDQYAVCIAGYHGEAEKKIIRGKTKKIIGWVYDKLKTEKGCYSYFEKHCDIEYWRERGYPHSKPE